MKRINSWSAALLLFTAAVWAEESRYEVKFGKNLHFRGGRVTIDHRFGDVVITTEPGTQVSVRATIRASDPEFGQQIRILTDEGAEGVSIRTEYPQRKMTRVGNFSYSVDYRISVPPNAPLSVKNRFGRIDATGLRASSELINAQGSVTLRDSKGAHTVENSFGSITVTNADGDTTVRNSNGSVRVDQIGGNINVSNRFGSIQATNSRNATINNSNGSVEVRDISGSLKVVNSFASVVASDIKGSAEVTNSNGRVEVSDVSGNATLRSSFGTVSARNVSGNLACRGAYRARDGQHRHDVRHGGSSRHRRHTSRH